MINDRFITYFRETFFPDREEELQSFLTSMEKSIPRTIRIKTGMEEQVKQHLGSDGWILTPTHIDRVYSMDRREDFDPFERRLGFSLDHLVGNFYIQELAAAHPVDILADHTKHLAGQKFSQKGSILSAERVPQGAVYENTVNEETEGQTQKTTFSENFLILDMASSPGGKTTQLAEYYPNSFIIANEPTRERIPQLLQNLDRMGTPNVGVTLYPGQYWKHLPETFDRVLLDAPCSGEGTLYKGTDAVKHWHMKNIKEISRLQTKLLDASLHALKVGGEMIYSTCALNLLENEGVVDAMHAKYGDAFEILFQKKFWPHIDGTGGFFITKLRKTRSLPIESEREKRGGTNEKLKPYRSSISPWKLRDGYKLYEHDKKILAVRSSGHALEDIYFMRYGEQIGTIENGRYEPNALSYRYLDVSHITHHIFMGEAELDTYLRGAPIESVGADGYILMSYQGQQIALEKRENNMIKNTFPKDWRRK